jgi:hypothetical protein
MNQTDTPRTNAAINASGGQWSFVLLDCSSELERELTAVTEQRDRLAEDLKQIYNVSLFDYDTMPEAARKKYREVVFAIADKALQSLNQPTEP